MFTTIKKIFVGSALIIALLPIGSVAVVNAAPRVTTFGAAICGEGDNTAKGQILQGAGQTGADCTGQGVSTGISAAINILSIIVGVAAVIVIIISGLKYVTSGGDSNGISSAKNTLIYALIGLVIAGSAQLLVHFVLFQVK